MALNVVTGFQILCLDCSFLPDERYPQIVTLGRPICGFCGIFPLEYKTFIWVKTSLSLYNNQNFQCMFINRHLFVKESANKKYCSIHAWLSIWLAELNRLFITIQRVLLYIELNPVTIKFYLSGILFLICFWGCDIFSCWQLQTYTQNWDRWKWADSLRKLPKLQFAFTISNYFVRNIFFYYNLKSQPLEFTRI